MNNQQRLEEIEQRLEMLNVLNNKMDTIISMLSDKRNSEPLTTFVKANANADDSELKSYEMELFQKLDNQRENNNVKWLHWPKS